MKNSKLKIQDLSNFLNNAHGYDDDDDDDDDEMMMLMLMMRMMVRSAVCRPFAERKWPLRSMQKILLFERRP